MKIQNIDLLGNYVNIQPIKAKFTDTVTANVMTVQINGDNLTDGAVFGYTLYNLVTGSSETPSYDVQLIFMDTEPITGVDYTSWNGNDITAPYAYVAGKKGIIIL